jgi:hypothetical protein
MVTLSSGEPVLALGHIDPLAVEFHALHCRNCCYAGVEQFLS